MDFTPFETAFREKALSDFHLDARYLVPIFDFCREIEEASYDELGELSYRKAKRKFKKLFRKYNAIFDAPDVPTHEDHESLSVMRKYLKNNKGDQFGYFKYRREHYHEQVALYNSLMMQRNMELLAHKTEFFEAMERRMELLDKHEHKAKTADPLSTVRRQKNRWSKEPVMCACGVLYTQGNKTAHVKTKHHKAFLLSNSKNQTPLEPHPSHECVANFLPECAGQNVVISAII